MSARFNSENEESLKEIDYQDGNFSDYPESVAGMTNKSRQSRSKTGGKITIMKLDPQDVSTDPKFKQDEFNRIDEELKQLEMVSIALKK